jgi:hypothetical protein
VLRERERERGGIGVPLDLLALLIIGVLAVMSFAYVAALTRL